MAAIKIAVERLQTGNYIKLPLSWREHPFLFSQFIIQSDEQIQLIKKLGLKQVILIPEKSTSAPLPIEALENKSLSDAENRASTQLAEQLQQEKEQRIEALKNYKRDLQRTEKSFQRSIAQVRSLMSKVQSRPLNAIEEGRELVNEIAEQLLSAENSVLHLMTDTKEHDNFYYHALNVSVLAMMLSKVMGHDEAKLKQVGLGALFHDLGKIKLPSQLVRKEKLNPAETNYFNLHPKYGAELLNLIEGIPDEVKLIVAQHHEYLDGTGTPDGKKAGAIHDLAQLVCMVNDYDTLCHPQNPARARVPYQAISLMYKTNRAKYNANYLNSLIRLLGIYPPGSVVQLSTGQVGIVVSVQSDRLLYPNVMVYDANVPPNEAPIVNLETHNLTIEKVIRPQALPQAIFDYLNPRTRISYYIERPDGTGAS